MLHHWFSVIILPIDDGLGRHNQGFSDFSLKEPTIHPDLAQMPSKTYLIDPAFKFSMTIGEDAGRLLENAVFLDLRQKGLKPHYVLKKQEVDFYWENGIPINVCLDLYNNNAKEREVKGMLEALNFLDKKEGLILTRDQTKDIQINSKNILVRPAWKFFLGNNDSWSN